MIIHYPVGYAVGYFNPSKMGDFKRLLSDVRYAVRSPAELKLELTSPHNIKNKPGFRNMADVLIKNNETCVLAGELQFNARNLPILEKIMNDAGFPQTYEMYVSAANYRVAWEISAIFNQMHVLLASPGENIVGGILYNFNGQPMEYS